MRCLVTYDVNQPHHAAVKELCIKAGFRDYVEMPDGSRKQLPNTTLIVEADNAEDAVNKFKEQVRLVPSNALSALGGFMSPSPRSALSGLGSPSPRSVRIEKVIGVGFTEPYAENEDPPANPLEAYRLQKGC